jgi:hypothetical protein
MRGFVDQRAFEDLTNLVDAIRELIATILNGNMSLIVRKIPAIDIGYAAHAR